MRLWVKDSERRPDPAPQVPDDATPMLVGLALWLVALVVALILAPTLGLWLVWTCVAGLLVGLIGLLYTHRRR